MGINTSPKIKCLCHPHWIPVYLANKSGCPRQFYCLSSEVSCLIPSAAAERFLEELKYATVPLSVSGSIQCRDKKPKVAADQPPLDSRNN